MNLYPLQFTPVYFEKIWGGRKLEELYHRQLPPGNIGESWDIAAHAHGMSAVRNGALAGKTLAELAAAYPEQLYGPRVPYSDTFPLLVKIIDARQALSVQVHPDDRFATLYEKAELGKTEAWYVLAADEGAEIVCGVKPGLSKADFQHLVESGNTEAGLRFIPVRAGDIIEIPAGLVHALGAGIVVAEVQQNSDTVYRVYDWGRVDDQGKPRELHVDKAFSVMDFAHQPDPIRAQRNPVVANEYFVMEVLDGLNDVPSNDGTRFHILLCLEGTVTVEWEGSYLSLEAGDSCLVPAVCQGYRLNVTGKVLRSYPPTID